MAYSTQRAVSDGTLNRLELSIDYIDQADINVYYDGVLADPSTWSWESPTSNAILFDPTIAAGVEVLLQRSTNLGYVLNIFGTDPIRGGNAKFTTATMDENFLQMLMIAQEAKEGSSLTDIYANLDIHGYIVKNSGMPVDPGDLANKAYIDALTPSLAAQVAAAQAAATAAAGSATAASGSASTAAGAASTASSAATSAGGSATSASGSATSASGSATAAAASASAASASAGAASGSATDAANSASAAATSETQAEYYAGQAATYGGSTPILFTCWFPSRAAIPAGYLPLDGQTFQRSTYPDAYAEINAGSVPTVADATWVSDPTQRGKYTLGDGSTTCRLPDYNGKYDTNSLAALILRGDGNLSAGTAGAIQRDAAQLLTGNFGAVVTSGTTDGPFSAVATGGALANAGSYYPYNRVSFDNSRSIRTASETRMANVTGVYCVKMAGVPINAGSLDLATLTMNMVDRRNNLSDLLDKGQARVNIGYGLQDFTSLESDGTLGVGQRAIVTYSAVTSFALNCACADGQIYRIYLDGSVVTGASTPAVLRINNTTYTNQMYQMLMNGDMTSTGSAGYYDNAMRIANGQPGGAEITCYVRTAHKHTSSKFNSLLGANNYVGMYYSRMCAASSGNVVDTTTVWSSLGTIVLPLAASGAAILERIR